MVKPNKTAEPVAGIGHNNPPQWAKFEFSNTMFSRSDELGEDKFAGVNDLIKSCGDLDKLSSPQIAELFAHVKGEFDRLKEATAELSKFIELMKNVKVPEAFDRDKISSFTLKNGTRVTKSERTTCTILDMPAAMSWLKENGYEDLVKETVNSSSMNSTAAEILSNVPEPIYNEKQEIVAYSEVDGPSDLPEDIFNVKTMPTTSVTKGKAKK